MTGKFRKFGPRLTVSLTGRDYDTLYALAERDEVSLSWVVRRAISEYLRRRGKKASPSMPLLPVRRERPTIANQLQERRP